jgi:hypothetical protein
MVFNNTNSDELNNLFHSQAGNANNRREILSMAAIEDKLVLTISSHNTFEIDEGVLHIRWNYLDQATALIYRINLYDPLPEFVIFTEDIPEQLIQELSNLRKITMKRVITNAIRRIYESVDPEYFHVNGIYGKVKWRLAS